MSEQFAPVGRGIGLCYESFGRVGDPTALMIAGLGAQMVTVSDDFCRQLVRHGIRVIRFDNRDVGHSTILYGEGVPSIWRSLRRDPKRVPYTLDDMAADTIGLLDTVGVGSAHLVGFSMGGMIAQIVAVRWPDRVSSLTSIMSSTGGLRRGWPAPRFLRQLLGPYPRASEHAIARRVAMARARGFDKGRENEAELWRIARLSHGRNSDRTGSRRQLSAMLASGDRTASLAGIRTRTLVIHGKADRFIHPSGGRATAAAIPEAELFLVDEMAHDVPPAVRPEVVAHIAAHINQRASDSRG